MALNLFSIAEVAKYPAIRGFSFNGTAFETYDEIMSNVLAADAYKEYEWEIIGGILFIELVKQD